MALAISLSSFCKTALTFSALSLVPSLSSLFSSHSLKTDFTSSLISLSRAFSILLAILSLTALTPKYIPSPYSALSSNNEFAHAGPWPFWFFEYAVAAPAAAHIDVHPVALAIIILSPNNWVTSLAYGVSPQPAQAPEYSSNGCSNWLPLTVAFFIGFALFLTLSVA